MGRKWLSSGVRKNAKRGKQNEEKKDKNGVKLRALRHFYSAGRTIDYFKKSLVN